MRAARAPATSLLLLLLLALLLVPRPALAEGTADQKATAQVLFDQARELVVQKRFAEACPKLEESLRLEPGVGTMLWLADCYENSGRTASAWAEFKDAAAFAAMQKDPREAVARRRITRLEPTLTKLAVVLPVGVITPGIIVRRDGIDVAPAALGVPFPTDPGVHTISATAPGRLSWSVTVEVKADRTTPIIVNVPVLAVDEGAPLAAVAEPSPVPVPPPPSPPPEPPPPVRESSWTTLRTVGAVTAGVGAIGLGIGAGFGLGAKSALDASNANGHCLADNECDAVGKSSRNDATHRATASTIAFVAGGAALAAGVVIFILAPSNRTTGLVVAPSIGGRENGIVAAGSF